VWVDQPAFEAAKRRVMDSAAPSSGDDLLGMEIDFVGLLDRAEGVHGESVTAKRTSDPGCLIEATCAATPGIPLEAAIRGIEGVWLSLLRYRYFEAHTTRVALGEAVLDFITQIDGDGFYVTGRVRVTAGRS